MDQFELEIAAEVVQGRAEDDAPKGQIDLDADAPEGDETTGEERSGRSPSRMPEGRFIITKINSVGEPTRPKVVLGPFKIAIECLVRDYAAITYRSWRGR